MILLSRHSQPPRRGVILLAVLIVIVILSLAAYAYNDLITSEYRAADTYVRTNQARAAADSGVAYVMGLLNDPNAYANAPLSSNPWNNPAAFQDVIVNNDDNPRKRTKFSIISLCSDAGTGNGTTNDPFSYVGPQYRFGVQDESAKLNVNVLMTNPNNDTARLNMLFNGFQNYYYPLTSDIGNYILDWMDPNPTSTRSPTAKDSTYMALPKPYHCKNGPFDSFEELLLVSNVTPQYLFGNDRNRNGTTLPVDDDGNPPNQGWSSYLTIYSHEPNIDINNNARIWVNDPNLQTLNTNLMNLSATYPEAPTVAQFIIAYRLYGGTSSTPPMPAAAAANGAAGQAQAPVATTPVPAPPPMMSSTDTTSVQTQIATDLASAGTNSTKNQIKTLSSLITSSVMVTIPGTGGRGNNSKSITFYSPMAYPANQQQLLPILFDELTTTNAADMTPRINVNTASSIVLNMLQAYLSPQEILNIQNFQPINQDQIGNQPDPNYNTLAWLILPNYANLAPSKVLAIEPFITARSRIYRFQSIGYCDSGTPVCRLEVVVDTSYGRPRVVYRRDISELGSGNFDFLPKPAKR